MIEESAEEESPVPAIRASEAPRCEVCGRQDRSLRDANYPWVASALFVTVRRSFAGRWCRTHRNLRLLLAGLITSSVGRLGIPWGVFYTPLALLHLARGGDPLKYRNACLLKDLARFWQPDFPRWALGCLEESLKGEATGSRRPGFRTRLRCGREWNPDLLAGSGQFPGR